MLRALVSLPIILLVVGCAANPFATAETIEQKAFAAYATYAITASKAANISEDPATPMGVRRTILKGLELTAPVARTLRNAALVAADARHQVLQAERTAGAPLSLYAKLDTAVGALKRLYEQSKPQLTNFQNTIKALES